MNIFILDEDMKKSAEMLDDYDLENQITTASNILLIGFNSKVHPESINLYHDLPIVKFYNKNEERTYELYCYLGFLLREHEYRFSKIHRYAFWQIGYGQLTRLMYKDPIYTFCVAKTYAYGHLTNKYHEIRKFLIFNSKNKKLYWTKRNRPDWWI